ncbi:hypothetical protein EGI22_16025 [Lacihabitans sp. LS3-19]|uniref:hypothetical protein n=1 Tax=Lacihabitans sp. LS3-19 TaxID=2487335 RepID=UPI0020CFC558|nr:hypothetical protein [Lacihabitans sp. LS3-19]MCP9769411.1 hypothetical protein [Lacihabitans sp. LS3-19]
MKQLIALLLILAGIVYACTDKKKEEEVIDCGCDYHDVEGEVDGKKAKFRIAYITQEKRYMLDSVNRLTDLSTASEVIRNFIPIFPEVSQSKALIAVGTASQEGENREREEQLARSRADTMMFQLKSIPLSNQKELYLLNLGQFTQQIDLNSDETDYQRRMIMIGIMEKDERLTVSQIGQCLQNAVQSPNGLNFNTNNYSLFNFTKMN